MKKKIEKKLALNKETLKYLGENAVAQVVGGSIQSNCYGSCLPGLCLAK